MPYIKLRYHFVIVAKNHDEFLTPEMEKVLYPALQNKAKDNKSMLLKIGGYKNHVHMVARTPSSITVADLIDELKSGSSRAINQSGLTKGTFEWQADYGALTVNPFELMPILRYVSNQEFYHSNHTTWYEYERVYRHLSDDLSIHDPRDENLIPFTSLRYHLITGTKNREYILKPQVENVLYPALEEQVLTHGGQLILANGWYDHVHLLAAIYPTTKICDFMRNVKTHVSRIVRKSRLTGGHFNWQDGYGAFSVNPFDYRALWDYIANQKLHHEIGSLLPVWPEYEKT